MDNLPAEFTEEVVMKSQCSKGITFRKTFCEANDIEEGDTVIGKITKIIKKK